MSSNKQEITTREVEIEKDNMETISWVYVLKQKGNGLRKVIL